MKTYRIVIEFSTPNSNPRKWDWTDILDVKMDEVLTIEDLKLIPTPKYHQEILAQNTAMWEA